MRRIFQDKKFSLCVQGGRVLKVMVFLTKKGAENSMRKIFFFVLVMTTPLLTMCSGPYGPMSGYEGGHMMNYGFGYGGMFMWILFLIVLGIAIYFIVQSAKSKNVFGEAAETPLDILKKRYAKGKITKEEFDRMKKELE